MDRPSRAQVLEDRLTDFAARVCAALPALPKTYLGLHVANQLARCATSPAANYAEARHAESARDFVHKLSLCVKELRETAVWLRLGRRLGWVGTEAVALTRECSELIAIFVASVRTARRRL